MVRWSKPSLSHKKKRVSVLARPKDADSATTTQKQKSKSKWTLKSKSKPEDQKNGASKTKEEDVQSNDTYPPPFCLSIETTQNVVNLCCTEIKQRGLHKVDIFKPVNPGPEDGDYEVNLVSTILRSITKGESIKQVIQGEDVRKVVTVLKWTLRNCEGGALIPYHCYARFLGYERQLQQGANLTRGLGGIGSFSRFLTYLAPKNQEIVCELFELFALVLARSHINQMKMESLAKSFALFMMSDNRKKFQNFTETHQEWTKCCNAYIHLLCGYIQLQNERGSLPFSPQPVAEKKPTVTYQPDITLRSQPISITVLKQNHAQTVGEQLGWWDLLKDSVFPSEDPITNDQYNDTNDSRPRSLS